MSNPLYFVGLDLGAAQFSAAIGTAPWKLLVKATTYTNDPAGFAALQVWLTEHACTTDNTVCCMEATGVYGEALAYFLVAQGLRVAVEPPLKVKRAFAPVGHKTDAADAQQIAEYACRYLDELQFWQPRPEVLEQLQVLLMTREHLVKQRTAHHNTLTALQRKTIRTPLAEAALQRLRQELKSEIRTLEKEIRRLIKQEPPGGNLLALLLTVPGVGLLLAAQILVVTRFATQPVEPKQLAAHLGICPYQYQSGKTVRRPATSRHYGPGPIRKLLHLAARSVTTHQAHFKQYYQRKLQEGKPKRLALNNVANKLLKVICAVLTSQTAYDPNYAALQAAPSMDA